MGQFPVPVIWKGYFVTTGQCLQLGNAIHVFWHCVSLDLYPPFVVDAHAG